MKNKKAEKTVLKLLNEFEKIRKHKGFSHDKLAELSGLNRSTISLLESKKITPTILTCLKIAGALDIDLHELLEQVS
ncbi:MAG: hypothetical protein A2887_04800 [Alphaproteobacteria bacterium RIFCSPLOWO2_01_FULL_40_26]|nr:MAG: hypothetical protein A3D15_03925 [Alphaproteobacteria bacterium RIFCSPHIGHO2_02_FULL_40_34]OFW88423.1 MAG: hypothetical protein A2794_01945 [Alphaproteobacteria bacterium RIFCSPHIGHO2_01_FULL_40_8]OFW94378.1 MAG: hypothetical protein A2887_04800 [Alphaproteobacteria bacterium RIFCSPLOWO2_01_FULL_40_26]OFX09474.1 MAG: hypothetical protein A3H30_02155 [Alphaproteobacteria bacterium RIFCSPLOWO2_02_FULL_40_19]OFX10728.1 MAG: hypothetical protein A3G22_02390 [Alphaproteobacteria bacterium RI